jgi:hypothetical protein
LKTSLALVSLCVALGGTACAHLSPSAAQKPKEQKVFVTGSHIAQRVDESGQPRTDAPLRVYSREQIAGTGRPGDLAQALRTLDPGLGP